MQSGLQRSPTLTRPHLIGAFCGLRCEVAKSNERSTARTLAVYCFSADGCRVSLSGGRFLHAFTERSCAPTRSGARLPVSARAYKLHGHAYVVWSTRPSLAALSGLVLDVHGARALAFVGGHIYIVRASSSRRFCGYISFDCADGVVELSCFGGCRSTRGGSELSRRALARRHQIGR